MAIKEVTIEGQKFFEVYIDMRSKVKKGARAQKRVYRIKSLREAQAIEKQTIIDCTKDLTKQENVSMTWGELLDLYEITLRSGTATHAKMQANILREQVAFLRRWTHEWYDRDCRELTPGDVRRVMNNLEAENYAKTRLRTMKTAINGVFRFGIDEGHLNGVHASPAQTIQLPKYVDDKPPQILGMAEIQRLLESARADDHPWYPVWFMALNTGMRSGELFAVEWSDVDWEKKLVTVSKSYNPRMKKVKSTKAGYWRKVPINSELEAMLKELRAKTPMHQQEVLPRLSRWANGEAAKFLRDYCILIGITSVNFHALRACFATHLLNAGVSSPVVKKICGWTEEKVMNRYIRLAGLDVAGATETLGFKIPGYDGAARKVAKVVNLHDAKVFRNAMLTSKVGGSPNDDASGTEES